LLGALITSGCIENLPTEKKVSKPKTKSEEIHSTPTPTPTTTLQPHKNATKAIKQTFQGEKAIQIRGLTIKGINLNNGVELAIDHEVWLPQRFVKEAKKMGANWVQLVLWVLVTDDGELIESLRSISNPSDYSSLEDLREQSEKTEEVMRSLIQYFHTNGLKVYLITYHERLGAHHEYGRGLKIDVDEFLDRAAEIAVKWAKIAEESGVEMYAPRKELQAFVGNEKALEWDEKILPRIRKVYNGSLVRGAFTIYSWDNTRKGVVISDILPDNMSGWDYLGVDFYGSYTETFDELEAMYAAFALKVLKFKSEHNLKGVVFEELGIPHSGKELYWKNRSMSADEILDRIYQIYFEVGRNIDGFFPWVWVESATELPGGRYEYVNPGKSIAKYYKMTEIPIRKVVPAEEYAWNPINYTVVETLIPMDSWFSWELNKAGPPSVRVVKVIPPGIVEINGVGIHASEELYDWSWDNYIFRGRFKIFNGSMLIHFRCHPEWRYTFHIHPISEIELTKTVNGKYYLLNTRNMLVEYGKWHSFAVLVKDDLIQVSVDGQILVYRDLDPLPRGSVVIDTGGTQAHILLDDLVVERIN